MAELTGSPLLAEADVHVWQIDLADARLDRLAGSLSPDEVDKAARLHTPELAQQYRRCRAALRCILGRYTQQSPDTVVLEYGPYGKPCLPDASLHFNLSHSERYALVALARDPVGVDIEGTGRAGINPAELASLLFHPEELAAMASIAPEHRAAYFYALWTRKEAYSKRLGLGFQLDLCDVSFEATAGGWRVCDPAHSQALAYCRELEGAPDGYLASVCTAHAGAAIGIADAAPWFD
ncbi:MAG: 4'-phosphopantetheinyl transferase superfamily protein [Pseudomonadota bacterium]